MVKLAHLSDVHIRLLQRHEEFKKYFENLYSSLKEQKVDHIIITGDILHSKTYVSPEQIDICVSFFLGLAKIAPLHLILGNHDCALSNLSRQDAVSAIVNTLRHHNVFFYKNSGVFSVDDFFNVVVFSCVDENWPTKETVSQEKLNIGIFHGMVKGAILQNGQLIEDCPYTLNQFLEIVDYLFLGDVHRVQILDLKYRAAYAGSLIQQNYGEGIEKGYLLWNVRGKKDHEVDFVQLPNVCPYYTIDVADDLNVSGDLPIQKGSRVRVFSRQLSSNEEDALREKIEKFYQPKELVFKDEVSAHRQKVSFVDGTTVEDLVDVGVQERLIRKFLEPYSLKEEVLNEVLNLNSKYDSAVRSEESVLRNVQYKIRKARWSNIGSYGEDNEFDFSAYRGIVGVFGKNAVGKSTLAVDVPLYSIFNTNSKGVVKNDQFINDKKDSCRAEIEIEAADKTYKISRETTQYVKSGKRQGKPVYQGKTVVNFRVLNEEREEIEDKDGEERSDTDKEIRKIFGTAEDIMATSICPQWRLLEFIGKKNTERQKILGRYFDIDAFYSKYQLANDDSKDLKSRIRFFEGLELDTALEEREKDLTAFQLQLKEKLNKVKICEKRKEELSAKIKDIYGLRTLEGRSSLSLEEIATRILKSAEKLKRQEEVCDEINKKISMHWKQLRLFPAIVACEIAEKERQADSLKPVVDSGPRVANDLDKVDTVIERLNLAIAKFEQCNCQHNTGCCMVEELSSLLQERHGAQTKRLVLAEVVENARNKKNEYLKLIAELSDLESALEQRKKIERDINLQAEMLAVQSELAKAFKAELQSYEEMKQEAEQVAFLKIANEEYNAKIAKLQEIRKLYADELVTLSLSVNSLNQACERIKAVIVQLGQQHKKLSETKQQYEAYEHYLKAVGKDGLPQIIIHNNLDIINKEIKKILSRKVNFSITLEANEEGKEIEVFFRHDKSKPRIIELCSGMEKTIAAIAIRAALVNVTTLPKPNIYVLDEVFSSLDDEYVDAVTKILKYLKKMFPVVIVITHLDIFKDLVDHVVLIERDDLGFARVLV